MTEGFIAAFLAFCIVTAATTASAGYEAPSSVIPSCQDTFKGLPKLAKRLGVKPNTGVSGSVVLHTCEGDYALFDLITALLDKMDKADRKAK